MPFPFATLLDAYAWLDSQINYERNLGSLQYSDRVFELEEFRARLCVLGDPQRGLNTIHIAGSRGKGSAAAALDALLRASGLTTARYTSPHLHEYRERITINGGMINADQFVRLLQQIALTDQSHMSYKSPESQGTHSSNASRAPFKTVFEHLTALFFLAARESHVDWSVIETGLGGRLDATNVIDPGPVLLTRIALEHTHLLGNTLEAIAAEKAAILKPGGWAIASAQESNAVTSVFQHRAESVNQKHASLFHAEQICPLTNLSAHASGLGLEYQFEDASLKLNLNIFGTYQTENIQNALAMFSELRRLELIPLVSRTALVDALTNISFPGRMERLTRPATRNSQPEIFIDGAHCPAGARALARTMAAHFGDNPEFPAIAAVAMLQDKDHALFFRELSAWPGWREVWCYPIDSPRAADPAQLAIAARPYFSNVRVFDHLDQLLQSLVKISEKFPSSTVATGSLHSLGAWRTWGMGKHGTPKSTPFSAQAEQVPGH